MKQDLRITGIYIQYYFICKRKLWLFARDIKMEEKSDLVSLGKLIDENTFSREDKHINIDNTINIDFIDQKGIINEVKKSKSVEKADVFQVKYYIYYLHKRGVENLDGIIHYPTSREKLDVTLEKEDIAELERIIQEIKKILEMETPPPVINAKMCKKCSYFELCYI